MRTVQKALQPAGAPVQPSGKAVQPSGRAGFARKVKPDLNLLLEALRQ